MTQRMSQKPDPTTPSGAVRICYDLDGVATPLTVKVTWSPGGQVTTHTVTGLSDRCWTETAPSDAEGGIADDLSAQSESFAITVRV